MFVSHPWLSLLPPGEISGAGGSMVGKARSRPATAEIAERSRCPGADPDRMCKAFGYVVKFYTLFTQLADYSMFLQL